MGSCEMLGTVGGEGLDGGTGGWKETRRIWRRKIVEGGVGGMGGEGAGGEGTELGEGEWQ